MLLDKFDDFLETQKKSEQIMLFLLPIMIFGFISYYFVYPVTNQLLKENQNKHYRYLQNINRLINQNRALQIAIVRDIKLLKSSNKNIQLLIENKKHFSTLLSKLAFLKFNIKKWSEFYNKIPEIAKKHHLVILNLKNISYEQNSTISKKLSFDIKVTGNFVDFVKFINDFENQKEILKIDFFKLDKNFMRCVVNIYGIDL